MTLSHTTLGSYYSLNFSLMQHHKYNLTEIEDMIPWERDIYVKMLLDYIETEKAKRENS
jgi:hypothetical protein